ncbi:uncharacterized protein zgc:194930 [Cyprinodon tularosa]|uniref:uncharacterized protein zgc:194930 n=1 Tax=Cyprinodon tularosa TaxID=77115 RepID=UPI0018E22B71|nr:uncharacterized protein zgc:194930 [Cyprinodon tularosa]XP_038150775.1 uncharacterized protein zgc:194930 [Cyprinodon tularosa]
MGCQCCRMVKSYIYDPSTASDVHKTDSAGSSLYQAQHHRGGDPQGDHSEQKQGFHNLGYSKSNDSTLKLEFDNNQVNQRLHSAPSLANELQHHARAPPTDGGLYIIQPEVVGSGWMDIDASQVPIYPNIQQYESHRSYEATTKGWDSAITTCDIAGRSSSFDEIDEGVGGTPEHLWDTGDEGSVLSVDIHTSTASLSSGGTRDDLTLPKTLDNSTEESGISVTKSEDGEEEAKEQAEVQSVTDSMVAEALAALEAATAGEDSD